MITDEICIGDGDDATYHPRWLRDTAAKTLDSLSGVEGDAYRLAIHVLANVEADNLPVPEVTTGDSFVAFDWECGDKELKLMFAVDGLKAVCSIQKRHGRSHPTILTLHGRIKPDRTNLAYAVDRHEVRKAVDWLFSGTCHHYGWARSYVDRFFRVGAKD